MADIAVRATAESGSDHRDEPLTKLFFLLWDWRLPETMMSSCIGEVSLWTLSYANLVDIIQLYPPVLLCTPKGLCSYINGS